MIAAGSKTLLGLVAAGWLAEALASTHGDIDAGVAAYRAGDSEAALSSYAAAEADLGEQPEIHFNKGLALLAKDDKEGARKAFEHGTESEHAAVAASAEYELGNLELDAEAFDAAIDRYIKCLKLQPDHASAKWNLELALLKKKQKEEEEKKKQEEQDKNKDEQNKDENKDEQNKDEKKDEEKKDEEKKDGSGDEEKKDEQKPEEPKPEEKKDEPKPEEKQPEEQKGEQPQPEPQPLDRADLDKALEQLDAEDQFQLGRPMGRQAPVERDW
jgi:Ca-activated chloride channel family protein